MGQTGAMSMQENKPVLPFRVLLLITAIAGIVVPFVILSVSGAADYGRMTIASSIGPLTLMGIMCGYKQKRIRKWFVVVLTWNSCYTAGFLLYGLFNHAVLHWMEYVFGFAIGMIVHFLVGLLIGGFFWAFSD
jgi:hypothetical protein